MEFPFSVSEKWPAFRKILGFLAYNLEVREPFPLGYP